MSIFLFYFLNTSLHALRYTQGPLWDYSLRNAAVDEYCISFKMTGIWVFVNSFQNEIIDHHVSFFRQTSYGTLFDPFSDE